jgi:phosphopantothenoylcysteine decarboxylase/phosphopantothenate--cysteine ligase
MGTKRGQPRPRGPLARRRVVVGVSGSIAAYKAAEVVSRLVQRGAAVNVVMTASAARFVGPLTFQALTRRRVLLDPFDLESIVDATHISLTDEADLVLVAPATANVLAKMAHGIADDALTSALLAVECPVLVAPAMNDRMWTHAATQENMATLKRRGVKIVPPGEGYLACGTYAVGRLAEPEAIVAAVEKELR